MSRRRIPLVAVLGLAVAFAATACGAGVVTPPATSPVLVAGTAPPLGARETEYVPSRPAPPLRLTDQDGRPFDLASLQGTPVLVYFGYTHCPDVCPTTLADARAAIRQVGFPVRVVFATIDPERDDVASMKEYVDAYRAGFIGLTGSAREIADAAAAWSVLYQRAPGGTAADYAMMHTSDLYLVDASGQLRHHIFFGAGADLIAKIIRSVGPR